MIVKISFDEISKFTEQSFIPIIEESRCASLRMIEPVRGRIHAANGFDASPLQLFKEKVILIRTAT